MKRTNPPKQTFSKHDVQNLARAVVMEEFGHGNYLMVNRHLLRHYGPDAAVFLSNLVDQYRYLESRGQLVDGNWFYLTHSSQMEQTRMTEHRLRNCKTIFKEDRALRFKVAGSPAKEWYYLDWERLLEILESLGARKTSQMYQNRKGLTYQNRKGLTSQNRKGYIREPKKNLKKNPLYTPPFPSSSQSTEPLLDVPPKENPWEEQVWQAFDQFWEMYPRKEAKKKAREKWQAIFLKDKKPRPDCPSFKTLLRAVKAHAGTQQWKDQKFIPHPATWLNQERWKDSTEYMNTNNQRQVSGRYQDPSYKYREPDLTL